MKLTPILILRKVHCTKNIIQVYYLKDSKYIFIFVFSTVRRLFKKKFNMLCMCLPFVKKFENPNLLIILFSMLSCKQLN